MLSVWFFNFIIPFLLLRTKFCQLNFTVLHLIIRINILIFRILVLNEMENSIWTRIHIICPLYLQIFTFCVIFYCIFNSFYLLISKIMVENNRINLLRRVNLDHIIFINHFKSVIFFRICTHINIFLLFTALLGRRLLRRVIIRHFFVFTIFDYCFLRFYWM